MTLQGTVLLLVLFTIYTDDFKSSSSLCSLYKSSDDSALADFLNSDSHFNQQVTEVTRWCKDNYLDLNVNKIREMPVDIRKKGGVSELITEGVTVERVKLTFECNTNNIVNKCHQRMFCMFRLRSFDVSPKTLHMFY